VRVCVRAGVCVRVCVSLCICVSVCARPCLSVCLRVCVDSQTRPRPVPRARTHVCVCAHHKASNPKTPKPPLLNTGKLRFKVKTDGTTWVLSADDDDDSDAQARKWIDAISAAVSRCVCVCACVYVCVCGCVGGWAGGGMQSPEPECLLYPCACTHPRFSFCACATRRLGQTSASPSRRVVVVEGTEFVLEPRYEVERCVRVGLCVWCRIVLCAKEMPCTMMHVCNVCSSRRV
jgi:hypothetical protein